jgi:DNA-binding NtrC family response regulator
MTTKKPSPPAPEPGLRTELEVRPLGKELGNETEPFGPRHAALAPTVERFRVRVLEPAVPNATFESTGSRACIGSHASNDVVIEDGTVSRFHCELSMDGGPHVKDLGSKNGTTLDGVGVRDALLKDGSVLRLGRASVRFELQKDRAPVPLSTNTRLGKLVGRSVPVRAAFGLLEKAAQSQATVLLDGETGTGKSQAALAIHQLSGRKNQPFVVVDCAAIPLTLLESELFGHEKGAFTGAVARRDGAFQEASGGTVFIDEIGELPPELQPRLLRVLEERMVRRVGSNRHEKVDVRVIAASQTDLRHEVNAGRFRPDLYFRLAVVRVPIPALRERPEDIPLIVERLLEELDAPHAVRQALEKSDFMQRLQHCAWPGNIRELRNHLERCIVMQEALLPETGTSGHAAHAPAQKLGGPLAAARDHAVEQFEREYLTALLQRHQGKVAKAALEAEVDRAYLYRLIKRHGLSGE